MIQELKKKTPTLEESARAEWMLSLLEHKGFRYLMSNIDRQGQELLDNLLNAVDDPKIPTGEREHFCYQIACNLKANRDLSKAINKTIYEGKTQEELEALGLVPPKGLKKETL